jgi:uncharacterized protein YceH (UPF0502 family)
VIISDKSLKADIAPVDEKTVLRQLEEIEISAWRYKHEDENVRHIGPMAQDFHQTFGYGKNEKRIDAVDASGVTLAAVKGLNAIVQEREAEIEDLKTRVSELEGQVAACLEALSKTE